MVSSVSSLVLACFLLGETTPVVHNAVRKVVPEMGRMNIVNESGEIDLTTVCKKIIPEKSSAHNVAYKIEHSRTKTLFGR